MNLHVPTKTISEPHAVRRLGIEAASYGERWLLITEEQLLESDALEMVKKSCRDQGVELIIFSDISPSSNSSAVNRAVELAPASKVSGIIGFGDLTSLSIAKAAAAIGRSKAPAAKLIHDGSVDEISPYPYFEIPATVRDPILYSGALYLIDARNGMAVRPHLSRFRAKLGILDPRLFGAYSQKYRLMVVLDMLLSAIEGYFSANSTFFSDTLFLRSIGLTLSNIPKIIEGANDERKEEERTLRLQQAGFFASYGLSMSCEGIGTATGHIIAAEKKLPQPVLSAILLPFVLEYGVKACPEKVSRMGPMLGENLKGLSVVSAADRVVESIRNYIGIENLPSRLSELGVEKETIERCAAQAVNWPLLDSLPKKMSEEDLTAFLRDAL